MRRRDAKPNKTNKREDKRREAKSRTKKRKEKTRRQNELKGNLREAQLPNRWVNYSSSYPKMTTACANVFYESKATSQIVSKRKALGRAKNLAALGVANLPSDCEPRPTH